MSDAVKVIEAREAARYLATTEQIPWELRLALARNLLRRLSKVRPIDQTSKLFEVGVGNGWFPTACAELGVDCSGIEYNPWFRAHALQLGREHGYELDILAGTIEHASLPTETYDVVVAMSVLEHVPDYRSALSVVYRSLKPGGILFLSTTNKFAPRSGEYDRLRLYGWLPQNVRYRLRMRAKGKGGGDVTVDPAHFDWNQFTHVGLSRALRQTGFSRVIPGYDLIGVEDLRAPSRVKRIAVQRYQASPLVRWIVRTFAYDTRLVAVK